MAEDAKGNSEIHEIGLIVSVSAAVIFCIWLLLRPQIMWLSFITSFYVIKYVYAYLPFLMSSAAYAEMIASAKSMVGMDPSNYGIQALYKLFAIHGTVLRWPILIWMIYTAWKTKKGVVRYRYRRKIKNVYDLIDIQANHFPASKIIRGKNLLKHHLYDGPWRTYAIPIDFALDNQLLWTHKGDQKGVIDGRAPVDEERMVPIPAFNKDEKLWEFVDKRKALPHYRYTALNLARANEVFAKQLGPVWNGSASLPPMERGLYAAFCAQAAGDAGAAHQLMNQMAFSWVEATYDKNWNVVTPHHCDITGAEELIAKHESHRRIQEVLNRHAHRYNVIFGVLNAARANGRIFSSTFLWLRPVNRDLFFHLNSDGGQCSFWENAGLWAHYQIECELGKRQLKPYVFSAVFALHDQMSREHWIEPGKYSQEAQRREVEKANQIVEQAKQTGQAQQSTGANGKSAFTTSKSQPIQPRVEDKHKRGDGGIDTP